MASDERDGVVGEFERLTVSDRGDRVRVAVHVRPKSSRSAILGVREGVLEVALTSPPADGEANSELLGLLAKALGVRRGDIAIINGASGRNKLIEANGLTPEGARTRLSKAKR